jgi:intraflagellar transport protein 172
LVKRNLLFVQNEHDREAGNIMNTGSNDAKGLINQARQWEEAKEYDRAVECYLRVNKSNADSVKTMATAWSKAAELAIKFLDSDKAIDVATTAGPLLVDVGAHNAAAQLYMGVEMIK